MATVYETTAAYGRCSAGFTRRALDEVRESASIRYDGSDSPGRRDMGLGLELAVADEIIEGVIRQATEFEIIVSVAVCSLPSKSA